MSRDRHMSGGSTTSMQSIAGTLVRVNTVASALKRFFSREDSRPGSSTADGNFLDLIYLKKEFPFNIFILKV